MNRTYRLKQKNSNWYAMEMKKALLVFRFLLLSIIFQFKPEFD